MKAVEAGFEIMEVAFNAKFLSLPTKDLLLKLAKEVGAKSNQLPSVRFFSIDIHNQEYPKKVFNEEGFEFISISPASVFADSVYQILSEERLLEVPLKVVVCDKGAVDRSEKLVEKLLKHKKNKIKKIELIYLLKKRLKAGIVKETKVEKREYW